MIEKIDLFYLKKNGNIYGVLKDIYVDQNAYYRFHILRSRGDFRTCRVLESGRWKRNGLIQDTQISRILSEPDQLNPEELNYIFNGANGNIRPEDLYDDYQYVMRHVAGVTEWLYNLGRLLEDGVYGNNVVYYRAGLR